MHDTNAFADPARSAASARSSAYETPPLVVRRNPRARRYVLRVDRDGAVVMTIPRGGTEAFARRFATEKQAWIRAQLDRIRHSRQTHLAWQPGTQVWFRGARHPIVDLGHEIRIGDLALPRPESQSDWRQPIEHQLRQLAASELPPRVHAAARLHGLAIGRIQIRDQRSRWGSCSRHRTISLNWRLVQLPEPVRDYLIAHELAHLRQMNHSPRFWEVVDAFFPRWREAERWLRAHGREVLA